MRPAFDYTFLFVKDGGCQPVRFNPCQPIRYAQNRRLATDAHIADLTEALAKLACAHFPLVATTLPFRIQPVTAILAWHARSPMSRAWSSGGTPSPSCPTCC